MNRASSRRIPAHDRESDYTGPVWQRSRSAPLLLSPDPEVVDRTDRRQFTASYKLRILDAVDACKPGEQDALLRREALYSALRASADATYGATMTMALKSSRRTI